MKYMFLIYIHELALRETNQDGSFEESATFTRWLKSRCQSPAANPLQRSSTIVSNTVRDGKTLVTDGPFAETREQLGG